MSIIGAILEHKAITTSSALYRFLGIGSESDSGVTVNPDTAMRCAAVYACVRVLSESVAQLPLITYRRLPNGGKERATDHWLYRLLARRPNPMQTSFGWREMMTAHLNLNGNAYCWINRGSDGQVYELWPLNPDNVEPKLLSDRSIVYKWQSSQGAQTLTADQVFHVRGLSLDGVTGVSPIAYNREAIGLAVATAKHGARLFSNGARPGGILTHPAVLSDPARKNLKESIGEGYTGDNAFRTLVLEEGMKWEALTMSNEDAQYLDTRKYQRSEIAGIFRVPPHMIGDLERATFSNIEQQGISFVRDSLMSWLARIEQEITVQLVPEPERDEIFAEFNVNGLMRGDMATRFSAYQTGIQNRFMSPNEVRALENMNPRDGGDTYDNPAITPGSGAGGTPDATPQGA